MSFGRIDRLRESSDFIQRMESPQKTASGLTSIRSLLADGKKLGREMKQIAEMPDRNVRFQKLRETVRPYLQLVTEKARCEHTGHLLADIWRYFRLSWANPPESTPGRSLLYIIRDAGQPSHPVMGIFALENAPIRIACRDDYLGWTVETLKQEIDALESMRDVRKRFQSLLHSLDEAVKDIDARGLCRPSEIAEPTPEVIDRLAEVAKLSEIERRRATGEWLSRESDEDSDLERSTFGNISKDAENALYRRKRAAQLSSILFSKREILSLLHRRLSRSAIITFLQSETGMQAMRYAITARKSRHVGTSILELNVCGAVPPYNHLLAGKLAALLAISPQVVHDYRERYGKRPSDIASRMKGKDVIRPAEVVFVGTTSLFSAGSSQYNRLRVPMNLFGRSGPDMAWELIGETEGFGTMHISSETISALRQIIESEGVNLANSVFGEGASPKFRTIRAGVEAILQPGHRATATAVAQHAMRRLVYGAWVATNGRDYLAGESPRPDYYFSKNGLDSTEGTQLLIDFWMERWLTMRLDHAPALKELARFRRTDWSILKQVGSDEQAKVLHEV